MTSSLPSVTFELPPCAPETSRQALGAWGEDIASAFLEARGYEVITRNWRTYGGELDIIAFCAARRALVAVEVKTRRAGGCVEAVQAISPAKYRRLRSLFSQWLTETDSIAPTIALDLIAITVDCEGKAHIQHIEDLL